MAKLKYLDLSKNPLNDLIPDVFKDIQTLRVLKCRGCRLKNINPQLYNLLRNLIELDFGENQFKYFDKMEFRDLKHLRILKIDGNQLPVIVNYLFTSQRSLEFLGKSIHLGLTFRCYSWASHFIRITDCLHSVAKLEKSVKPIIHLSVASGALGCDDE